MDELAVKWVANVKSTPLGHASHPRIFARRPMKLARYAANGAVQIGRIDQSETAITPLPGIKDMFEAIGRSSEIKAAVAGKAQPLAEVKLLAPIPTPHRNIFCVGKNYRDHAKEFSNSG